MTKSHPTVCAVCGEPLPAGRRLYCTTLHQKRAKMQRYRARRAGKDVETPSLPARRDVASEVAHRLASSRPQTRDVAAQELAEAQRETARLKSELSQRTTALNAARKTLKKEREQRVGHERELRFISLAFARTVSAAGIAGKLARPIYSRLTPWLPEGDNPWA